MIPVDPLIPLIGEVLTAQGVGWAIAGGWAIDLFLGRLTRSHADVDVAVWRDEQQRVREAFPGWRFSIADAGKLRSWPSGTFIAPPIHELHAISADDKSTVEFLLNDRHDGEWLYRRNPEIRLGLADAIRHEGPWSVLAPQIVLLYKSKAPRANDEADFQNALPRLSEAARKWLADAIARADASHPWVARLRDAEG